MVPMIAFVQWYEATVGGWFDGHLGYWGTTVLALSVGAAVSIALTKRR